MEAILDLAHVPTCSATRRRIGLVLTGLPVLFLTFDSTVKLVHIQAVTHASALLGWPDHLNGVLGIVLLACLVVFLVPRTAVVGAVLLTGYLGGAVAAHLRVEDPLFSHTLFPVYIAALIWGGLLLRDGRLRAAVGKPID
jgi:DoxX-like family